MKLIKLVIVGCLFSGVVKASDNAADEEIVATEQDLGCNDDGQHKQKPKFALDDPFATKGKALLREIRISPSKLHRLPHAPSNTQVEEQNKDNSPSGTPNADQRTLQDSPPSKTQPGKKQIPLETVAQHIRCIIL